jgi:uncharacterized membrane protein (UPF0127 family)
MIVELYGQGRVARVDARLAITPEARARGFAGSTSIGPDESILFVFPTDTTTPFTMAQTGIPLDILFLDRNRRMVAVFPSARAFDQTFYVSPVPYRYVIELPGGWLASRGVALPTTASWAARILRPI